MNVSANSASSLVPVVDGPRVIDPRCNVLITAASRRVPLVHAFRDALARRGAGRVIVTDVNPLSPAVCLSERAYHVPLSTDPRYLDEVLAIAIGEQAGVVIPTIDDELTLFADARTRFTAAGVCV